MNRPFILINFICSTTKFYREIEIVKTTFDFVIDLGLQLELILVFEIFEVS